MRVECGFVATWTWAMNSSCSREEPAWWGERALLGETALCVEDRRGRKRIGGVRYFGRDELRGRMKTGLDAWSYTKEDVGTA